MVIYNVYGFYSFICMLSLVRNTEDKGPLSLNYNEYIVYNPDQVQPKFLVKVQFLPKPVYENLY